MRRSVLVVLLSTVGVLPPHAGAGRSAPLSSAGGPSAGAITVSVIVSGISGRGGQLGVALYSSPDGFPDQRTPLSQLRPHTTGLVDTVTFRDVAPGRYAVAVQHDLNSNGVLDRNMIGAPKEPWGVSRDVRHAMRAPRFEQAAFDVRVDTVIAVRVAR